MHRLKSPYPVCRRVDKSQKKSNSIFFERSSSTHKLSSVATCGSSIEENSKRSDFHRQQSESCSKQSFEPLLRKCSSAVTIDPDSKTYKRTSSSKNPRRCHSLSLSLKGISRAPSASWKQARPSQQRQQQQKLIAKMDPQLRGLSRDAAFGGVLQSVHHCKLYLKPIGASQVSISLQHNKKL